MTANITIDSSGLTWRYKQATAHFFRAGISLREAAEIVKIQSSQLATVNQVHGSIVATASIDGESGAPVIDKETADAIVTGDHRLSLVIKTADCLPLAIAGSFDHVAAVHAGWRGAVGGVVENCVKLMHELGDPPLRAMIGPCIRSCCFEVGEDVAARFAGHIVAPSGESSTKYVDLAGSVTSSLQRLGVSVDDCGICTCCSGGHFNSYRRDGEAAGRQFMLVSSQGEALV